MWGEGKRIRAIETGGREGEKERGAGGINKKGCGDKERRRERGGEESAVEINGGREGVRG